MEKLKERWIDFCQVILDPWTFILILVTIALLYFSISPLVEKTVWISSALNILSSLSSGIIGARIYKRYEEITSDTIVIKIGRVSIDALKLLLSNISALEDRVITFLREKSQDIETNRNYSEIINLCGMLEEEAVNSIQNWKNIIPKDALNKEDEDLKLGIITKLKKKIEGHEADLKKLSSEADKSSSEHHCEISRLKNEIVNLQEELSRNKYHSIYNNNLFDLNSSPNPLTIPTPGVSILNNSNLPSNTSNLNIDNLFNLKQK
ncbi:MAG TPA: TIGR04086 family membrane protein [Gammaproteobacteria bacterium]|nr:TIGR04086 family membrane protein [Gammaproteobacteria bacterium]